MFFQKAQLGEKRKVSVSLNKNKKTVYKKQKNHQFIEPEETMIEPKETVADATSEEEVEGELYLIKEVLYKKKIDGVMCVEVKWQGHPPEWQDAKAFQKQVGECDWKIHMDHVKELKEAAKIIQEQEKKTKSKMEKDKVYQSNYDCKYNHEDIAKYEPVSNKNYCNRNNYLFRVKCHGCNKHFVNKTLRKKTINKIVICCEHPAYRCPNVPFGCKIVFCEDCWDNWKTEENSTNKEIKENDITEVEKTIDKNEVASG